MTFEYVKCNICNSDEIKIVQRAEEPFKVVKCKNCGLVYINPRPVEEDLIEHYTKDYYKEWSTIQEPRRISIWKERLKRVERYRKGERLLDVGCGTGLFLKLAKEHNWQVWGTEISKWMTKYAKERWGRNIAIAKLEEACFSDNYFDVITLWHVLEHLTDPLHTLKEVKRILKPAGLVVIAVPNVNNLIYQLAYIVAKGKRIKLFSKDDQRRHVYHFSSAAIRKILKKAGLKPVEMTVDGGRVLFIERFIDNFAWLIHLIFRVNLGNAIEVYAVKE